MTAKRGVGYVCKCGAPVWLWDTEMETEEELAELRGWKQEDGWTRMALHFPNGCGAQVLLCGEHLVLLERQCAEASIPRPIRSIA